MISDPGHRWAGAANHFISLDNKGACLTTDEKARQRTPHKTHQALPPSERAGNRLICAESPATRT